MSELFDEFEFKPLTEGLGFHKKATSSEELTPIKRNSSAVIDLSTPLPREALKESKNNNNSIPLPTTTVDEILKTLNDKKKPHFVDAPKAENILPEFRSSTWDFSAFLLDFMLVLAINLTCLIILLVTTKVDLFTNIFNPDPQKMIYWSLISLFAGSSWMYLVLNRIFLGYTPGEWVFDQRLGRPEETGSALYTLKVALRSALVIASGYIIFPLISAFTGYDSIGRWLGIELVKKA